MLDFSHPLGTVPDRDKDALECWTESHSHVKRERHNILEHYREGGLVINLRNLRSKEIKWLAQGHMLEAQPGPESRTLDFKRSIFFPFQKMLIERCNLNSSEWPTLKIISEDRHKWAFPHLIGGFYRGNMHQFKGNKNTFLNKISGSAAFREERATRSCLTSISRGRRVTLCMGRMRKEIMGRFLQSSWDSIRDNTSLKDGLVALRKHKEETS